MTLFILLANIAVEDNIFFFQWDFGRTYTFVYTFKIKNILSDLKNFPPQPVA